MVKYCSDVDLHSVPVAKVHPNGSCWIGQSMNDKIVVYDCKSGLKLIKQKFFSGHTNQGYACGISVSPDGKILSSADAGGKLWFWDWKTIHISLGFNVYFLR